MQAWLAMECGMYECFFVRGECSRDINAGYPVE